nr:hypothetical protein [Tanacetum cinerariifolium]
LGLDDEDVGLEAVNSWSFSLSEDKESLFVLGDIMIVVMGEQQGESSAQKKSTIIRIPRRRQPDTETLVLTAYQINVDSLDEATRISLATARSIKDFDAQQVFKKVEEHLIDEDIEKLMEGDEEMDDDKFFDDVLNIQEDPGTRIESRSRTESPKVEKIVNYTSIDEEVKEESVEVALIRKKGKCILEIKDTPITTIIISPRTNNDSLSSDKEKLQELTASKPTSSSSNPKTNNSKHIKVVQEMVDETTNDNMKKNLLMVVKEAIMLEREKTKADIASMVADVVRKEQERTRATISS